MENNFFVRSEGQRAKNWEQGQEEESEIGKT
jgi:hypothetical protein